MLTSVTSIVDSIILYLSLQLPIMHAALIEFQTVTFELPRRHSLHLLVVSSACVVYLHVCM